jgi:hypothetical protein
MTDSTRGNEKVVGIAMVALGAVLALGLPAMYFLAIRDGHEAAFWQCSKMCGLYDLLRSIVGLTGIKIIVAAMLGSAAIGAIAWGARLLNGRAHLN